MSAPASQVSKYLLQPTKPRPAFLRGDQVMRKGEPTGTVVTDVNWAKDHWTYTVGEVRS